MPPAPHIYRMIQTNTLIVGGLYIRCEAMNQWTMWSIEKWNCYYTSKFVFCGTLRDLVILIQLQEMEYRQGLQNT
jgi:hypothetical protein